MNIVNLDKYRKRKAKEEKQTRHIDPFLLVIILLSIVASLFIAYSIYNIIVIQPQGETEQLIKWIVLAFAGIGLSSVVLPPIKSFVKQWKKSDKPRKRLCKCIK